MTLYRQRLDPGVTWLWSPVYKGLEIRVTHHRAFWIGWTSRDFKRRGW